MTEVTETACIGWWRGIAMLSSSLACAVVAGGGRMEVVVVDGGGDAVDMGGHNDGDGWEATCLFVDGHLMFSANAAYAAQYKDTMVAYMIYYVKS